LKILTLIAAGSFCVASQMCIANPVKMKAWDFVGTKFLVSVDWDANVVSAKLIANPAGLSGDTLEQSMQGAVYYGSEGSCRMSMAGRKRLGPKEVVGRLLCP
jgi:hypothetical protein